MHLPILVRNRQRPDVVPISSIDFTWALPLRSRLVERRIDKTGKLLVLLSDGDAHAQRQRHAVGMTVQAQENFHRWMGSYPAKRPDNRDPAEEGVDKSASRLTQRDPASSSTRRLLRALTNRPAVIVVRINLSLAPNSKGNATEVLWGSANSGDRILH